MTVNILDVISSEHWVITHDALENIASIAKTHLRDPEAIAAKVGTRLENTQKVTVRDNVSIVPVVGPIFRKANLFVQMSGATSTELFVRDFQTAVDDDSTDTVLLHIESPGGQVSGIGDAAKLIFQARSKKKIIAFIDGVGGSGAYWLAAQAETIYASETALIGSIGVILQGRLNGESGAFDIVSANAPDKRLNVMQRHDRNKIEALVDSMEDTFIAAVAKGRGVSMDTVRHDFGQGGTLIAKDALAAGMIDEITTLESLLSSLKSSPSQTGAFIMSNEISTVAALRVAYPVLCQQIFDEGKASAKTADGEAVATAVTAERDRIKAIMDLAEAKGREKMAAMLALSPGLTADNAKSILDATPAATADPDDDKTGGDNTPDTTAAQELFGKLMQTLGNPDVKPDGDNDPKTEDEEIDAWVKEVNSL